MNKKYKHPEAVICIKDDGRFDGFLKYGRSFTYYCKQCDGILFHVLQTSPNRILKLYIRKLKKR